MGTSRRSEHRPAPRRRHRSTASHSLDRALDLAGVAVRRLELAADGLYMNPAGWAVVGLPVMADGAPTDQVRSTAHPDHLPPIIAAAEQALNSDPALGPPRMDRWVKEFVHAEDRAYVAERVRRSNQQWEPLQEFVVRPVDGVEECHPGLRTAAGGR